MGGQSRARGLSLIELVMVVAIVGIVWVIAIPRYGAAQDRYRADGAAQRIMLDLTRAQAEARATSSSRELLYSPSSHSYLIREAGNKPAYVNVKLGEAPFQADLKAATLGGDTAIVFNGLGVPDSGGSIVLQVGRQVRTITVSPGTGAASVQALILKPGQVYAIPMSQ